jgi:sodium transport system permease protein
MRGRSVKEAQANVSVLLFAASVLPLMQMFMQRKEPEWLSLVPIAGQYSLLARVLRGDPLSANAVLVSGAGPLLLTLLALLLTARLLSKESVIAGK